MTQHPGADDLAYLRSHFVALDDLARAHGHDPAEVRRAIDERRLPGVPYVLEAGTELVAPDYFELAHLAGGFDELREWFVRTYDGLAAGRPEAGTGEEEWEEYRTGIYAVCLRAVTPSAIIAKGLLMAAIERLVADPAPDDPQWRRELSAAVDALDALEKPFAEFDRARFGPVSRDRLITAVRARFGLGAPEVSLAA